MTLEEIRDHLQVASTAMWQAFDNVESLEREHIYYVDSLLIKVDRELESRQRSSEQARGDFDG